jgi:hypothetical protein
MRVLARTLSKNLHWKKGLLLAPLYVLLAGCHSHAGSNPPSITFSKVPSANEGGADKIDTIEGRVTGARADQQIVLFAKAAVWWVQPLANRPYTKIQADGTWASPTHLGTDYAALLVNPGYQPPATTEVLPGPGGGVVAVASIKGRPNSGATAAVTKTVHFSGYDWKVRTIRSERGGVWNTYDPANVWTDEKGFLHLTIKRQSDHWTCSEVNLTRSFGYGTYLFVVQDVSHLEPAAALSMFTWSDLGADQNHREMDIEISRWGDPASENAQYVIQPYYVPANVVRFTAPAGPVTYSFRWEPESISFEATRGAGREPGRHPIAAHVFTSEIPSPGDESAHVHLCAYTYGSVPLQHEAEVVIEKFQYLP